MCVTDPYLTVVSSANRTTSVLGSTVSNMCCAWPSAEKNDASSGIDRLQCCRHLQKKKKKKLKRSAVLQPCVCVRIETYATLLFGR